MVESIASDNWCAPFNNGACNNCNSGRLVQRATCTNSYCDNMALQCANPPVIFSQSTFLSGLPAIVNQFVPAKNFGWTSDEQGANSTNAVCPAGTAMVGATSTGSFSDNVRTICQTINRNGTGWSGINLTVIRSGGSISDEAPNTSFGVATWLSGASCTGSYCDNMFYWFTVVN